MDINLLVLSAGNSRVAMGVFQAGELTYVTRIAHEQRADWGGRIAEAWERIHGKDNAAIAGSSVNPVIMEALEHVVQETAAQRVEWVGRELDVPIAVKTENPKETGVDRVLSVAAAYEQLGKACVVVDAGTAVTVNLCNDAGEFLGGAIAPGVKLSLDALHEKTARLPSIEFAAPTQPYGHNTAEAMRAGVYHGIRGMVRDVVENYATEIGTWPELIATGGDAAELFEGWELVHAISPDLVLYGIALAYANHHIRHGT